MGKWFRISGKAPAINWAKGLSKRHQAYRGKSRDGGFYLHMSELHANNTLQGFRTWGLRVDELSEPPRKSQKRATLNGESEKAPPRRQTQIHRLRRRRRREVEECIDREETIELFGTTVADIRGMAFSHSKSEVAYLLGTTVSELNQALLNEEIEPIYFGYKCKRCRGRFQGPNALRNYRRHLLKCEH